MLDDATLARLTHAFEQMYGGLATVEAVHPTSLSHVVGGVWVEFRLPAGRRVHAWFHARGATRSLRVSTHPPSDPTPPTSNE